MLKLVFYSALIQMTLGQIAIAASFDCSKAATAVEKTICSNSSISSLDEDLANLYKPVASTERDNQRAWIKERNQCNANEACLTRQYLARIAQLRLSKDEKKNPQTFNQPNKEVIKSPALKTNDDLKEQRKADEVEKTLTAAAVEEKRKVDNLDKAEKSRISPLAPSLTMKCENQQGWEIYIMHLNNVATVIKPVKNPISSYNPVAQNVKILNYGKPEFWYDVKDLNRGFNNITSSTYRGITNAKLDLRKEILGRKNDPEFGLFSETFLYGKWETLGGTYKCFDMSPIDFNAVLLKNKIK
jgi:uncharacterized protein